LVFYPSSKFRDDKCRLKLVDITANNGKCLGPHDKSNCTCNILNIIRSLNFLDFRKSIFHWKQIDVPSNRIQEKWLPLFVVKLWAQNMLKRLGQLPQYNSLFCSDNNSCRFSNLKQYWREVLTDIINYFLLFYNGTHRFNGNVVILIGDCVSL